MENNSRHEYLNFVEEQFEKCFSDKGYIQEIPVPITSKVDPSTAFVGSTISPMKPYLLDNNIGKKGRFLIQNCMRTQVLKGLKDREPRTFGSCFKGMGILTEPDLDKVVYDTFDYLTNPNYLNIPLENLRIRINSQDEDLLRAIEQVDSGIIREIDTYPERLYRHKYGMEEQGITGRNFNVGVRKKDTDTFYDIGNIIVMEDEKKKHAIEMGFGNCTFSMSKFGVDNTVASSRMADVMPIDSIESMKMGDAMNVVATLQYEDVQNHPKFSRYFKGLFKKYNDVIAHWQGELSMSDRQILENMEKYIALEYGKEIKGENTWTREQ